MLFKALAVASLGVVPTHALEKTVWDIAWVNACGPSQDGRKKCVPNTITGVPTYWLCNGEDRNWEPTEELCKFDNRHADQSSTPDGDWHIGCNDPCHCGYYKDHSNKRSMESKSGTGAKTTAEDLPDWLNISDWEGIDTRCSLTSIDLVEKFNGEHWVHHYKCPAGTSCTDILGSGACRAGEYEFTIPGRSRLWVFTCPDAIEDPTTCHFSETMYASGYPKPHEPYLTGTTRCSPNGRSVQYLDDNKWKDIYACMAHAVCVEHGGRGGCKAEEDHLSPPVQQTIAQPEAPIHTRCEPLDETKQIIQYLHPTAQQWLRFYKCGGRCFQFLDFAACEEYRDKYVVPSPPKEHLSRSAARRDLNPQVDGLAHDGLPRQDPYNANVPGFLTYDTRCNPRGFNEVQRFNGTTWIHFYQCTFPGSCIDVDGHGACRSQGNVYDVPSANRTSIKQGEGINPLRAKTRCNKSNASEVLQWEGQSWEPHGVCLPPYECYDFAGGADSALCVQPDAQYRRMWLPWPALSRSTNSGQITRCKDLNTLEQFKNSAWAPYRICHGFFTCRTVEGGPNSGCAAPSLYDVLSQIGFDSTVYDAGLDFPPRLTKDGNIDEVDDSMLRSGEQLTEQGKMLVSEGKTLMALSNSLRETFSEFGDSTTSVDDFAAVKEHISDTFSSNPDKHKETVMRDAAVDRAMHRRSLIEDSFGIHKQGARLVEEGNKLINQGRRLLQTILRARTEDYTKSITRAFERTDLAGDPVIIDMPDTSVGPDMPDMEIGIPDIDIDIHSAHARDEDSDFDFDFDTE